MKCLSKREWCPKTCFIGTVSISEWQVQTTATWWHGVVSPFTQLAFNSNLWFVLFGQYTSVTRQHNGPPFSPLVLWHQFGVSEIFGVFKRKKNPTLKLLNFAKNNNNKTTANSNNCGFMRSICIWLNLRKQDKKHGITQMLFPWFPYYVWC